MAYRPNTACQAKVPPLRIRTPPAMHPQRPPPMASGGNSHSNHVWDSSRGFSKTNSP
jgi:hypothetical protein